MIAAVRGRVPLVHCLTATVSMSIVTDGLLAAGARPMMTETLEEAPTMTLLADAVLLNLGTLSTDGAAGIPVTAEITHRRGAPWVLDPAAVGAGPVRARLADRLLDLGPAVVRANASEVLALAGRESAGRGADAGREREDAVLDAAHAIAARTGGAVAVSGATDLVVDAHGVERIEGGTPLLTRVTGTGCLLGGLTAAALAVTDDPRLAAVAATRWLGRAGQLAADRTARPGSFLDALDEVE